ncbi:hypothetical protein CRUP_019896 [Coryphaenoides rupestris]|nr:hypothetical protein CRUP_019896 [Coryphaenoides rupestris]
MNREAVPRTTREAVPRTTREAVPRTTQEAAPQMSRKGVRYRRYLLQSRLEYDQSGPFEEGTPRRGEIRPRGPRRLRRDRTPLDQGLSLASLPLLRRLAHSSVLPVRRTGAPLSSGTRHKDNKRLGMENIGGIFVVLICG